MAMPPFFTSGHLRWNPCLTNHPELIAADSAA